LRQAPVNQLFTQLALSVRKPEFWAYASWLDIVTRYRRTRLGLIWLLAPVAMFMFVLGPLYARLFDRGMEVFMVHLGMGYAIWRLLVMVINDSIVAFRSNKPFILDGNTRLTDYTLKSIAKSVFYFAFAMFGMVAVLIWSPAVPAWAIPSLLITIPIVIINLFWMGYCIAILGARSPDFGEVMNTVLMVGFLFTPILWEGERFPVGSIAGWIVRLNPAFHFLEIVRAPLFGRLPEINSMVYIAVLTVMGWGLASFLCRRYARFVPIWI
jgi:ABC-2 type transport system permease protein